VRNEYLCTTKQYDNFELRLKFKLLGKSANGGVQIRSQRVPHSNEMCGYQADMGEVWWGCLYGECHWRDGKLAGPTPAEQEKIIHFEDWNDYVIRCQGRRIQLWVNGRRTVDYAESNPSILQTGVIGLQIPRQRPNGSLVQGYQDPPAAGEAACRRTLNRVLAAEHLYFASIVAMRRRNSSSCCSCPLS
jgi:hypothetical protein